MGESKRRAAAGCVPRSKPQIDREAIASAVRAISLGRAESESAGGLCVMRNALGCSVLNRLGIKAQLGFGSALFRAGASALSDVVAYAGPNNAGWFTDRSFLGHAFIVTGAGDLVDFSCGDWRAECERLQIDAPDGLPPIVWDREPPPYVWDRRDALMKRWSPTYTPPLGEIVYGPMADVAGVHERCKQIQDEVSPRANTIAPIVLAILCGERTEGVSVFF